MQHVPIPIRSTALGGGVPRRPVVRLVLSTVLACLVFSAAADGLGVVLHLIGVMPLMP